MQFALIHGGWQSGWCWDGVRDHLTSLGHDVVVPVWLGRPGDTVFNETTAVLDHAGRSVAAQIHASGLTDVILVGHSGGGPVMQSAAEHLGSAVRRLVFVNAWVLRDAEAIIDVVPLAEQFRAVAEAREDRSVEVPPAWWSDQLLNGAPSELIAESAARLVPLPFSHFEEPISLPGFWNSPPPTSYVFLDDDLSVDPTIYQSMAERLSDPLIVHCRGPHEVMLTAPVELADALLAAAP